ncbi:multidrug ABC transporter ATP-binding protein [Planctomycetia bacterium]|nr:multidrug ABC transporter ATP-binding protein [Planctomycetia bacterium]
MSEVFAWNQVTKRFGSQLALRRFSLSSEPGSVVALLGDNGAGKTTAIRILLGLLEPTNGQSHVFGLDSQANGPVIRQRVGYVPDRPALYEWMTIEQIGWFAAGFYPDGFYQRFCEYVGQFGLPIDKKIKTLSKGMRSKVSLALCMGHEPELLVLDEPTSGLDPVVRREFLESMVDVAARGRTVLLSSHQIAEVERIADVIAIIRQGELLLVERLDKLKAEVRELTLTLNNGGTMLPDLGGTIISQHQRDRQWRVMLRGGEDSRLVTLRDEGLLIEFEFRQPTLEDIFVEVLKSTSAKTEALL